MVSSTCGWSIECTVFEHWMNSKLHREMLSSFLNNSQSFMAINVYLELCWVQRPSLEISAMVLHQKGSDDCTWVPRKFEVNSWISLHAPRRGGGAKTGDFKEMIKGFRLKPNSSVVDSVLVSHAYGFNQLQLEKKPPGNVNCK